jgi:hypothetical protein
MTKPEVNRTIHEAMGFIEIEWSAPYLWYRDVEMEKERGGRWRSIVPDYCTPAGFFACWNWAKEQGWWDVFLDSLWRKVWGAPVTGSAVYLMGIPEINIDHLTFAPILAEWLREREK